MVDCCHYSGCHFIASQLTAATKQEGIEGDKNGQLPFCKIFKYEIPFSYTRFRRSLALGKHSNSAFCTILRAADEEV